MEIVIHAMGMPFNGETIKSKSLGGSESAAYYQARELARRGHHVSLFTSSRDEGEWDGVKYVWHGELSQAKPLGERFAFYAENTPHDALIIQRHPMAFHKDYASKINIWQCHDLALARSAAIVNGGLSRVTFTTGVSHFHTQQIKEVYGISDQAIRVVPNGVDPTLYGGAPDALMESRMEGWGLRRRAPNAYAMLYQSRPERGLEHLVRPGGIMDRLRNTGHTLYVCGYENTTQEMAGYYAQLRAWADALPNVVWMGALTKQELAWVQEACNLLIYPTEFEEVSCITAMEAMHAGLPFISSHHAALPETCRGSGSELLPLKDGMADEDAFVAIVRNLRPADLKRMRESQLLAAKATTWERAVDHLEAHIRAYMATTISEDAVARHCIEHADIGFFDWFVGPKRDNEPRALSPIMQATMHERREMYRFIEEPETLQAHYERFEGENLDRMVANGLNIEAEVEGFMRSSRGRGIINMLSEVVKPGSKVLEFGCAHGHITLMLAKLFPHVQFTGMDFMGKSIGLAIQHAQTLGVSNVTFMRGSLPEVPQLETYDVIIAAEVIEHIYDYHGALETLRKAVVEGGTMIITTPYGRWEWLGHEAFRVGREHLHHFEKQDWRDICGTHDHTIVCAPSGDDGTGKAKGSWLIRVTPKFDVPFGRIDYARKLSELCPRQTVSACMIVKDAEHVLAKSLQSIETYVDEFVIAVDPATTDDTMEVLTKLQMMYPYKSWRVFRGARAMQDGFDTARNRTVDEASGDWILWMDSDEELPAARNIFRLLRHNSFNAFACPQIHYSLQPAQVLTTDYPARLFRANRGIRFYGRVHEHPEDAPGKSITPVSMAPDVQFLHNGYVDEETRRARYYRNLPLLMRDIQDHPDRILNKFLLLRDLAQGVMFELQQGAPVDAERHARLMRGVTLFEELLDLRPVVLRMVLDSLQYYTVCNELLGAGFVAKVSWKTAKPPFDSLSAEGAIEARFFNRAVYLKLMNLIAEETTKVYESRYV